MTLVDAKDLAEIAALVLAGGWAIYGFIVLRHREKATAELRKLDLDLRKAELEARAVANLHTEIKTTSAPRPDGPGYCIFADVTLTNRGLRDTQIKWEGEPAAFVVRRAEFDDDGIPQFRDSPVQVRVGLAINPSAEAISHVIRAVAHSA